jgi:cytochrome c553
MRIRLLVGTLALVVGAAVYAQEGAQTPAAPAQAPAPPASADAVPPAAPALPETTSQDAAGTAPAAATAAPAATAAEPVQPGDPVAGEAKAATCGACHGLDGNSADPQYPKLAGQHEAYIARQLELFKNGGRQNPIMLGFAAPLSPQDMRDIGAFYATKVATPGLANDAPVAAGGDETWVARGERLYRGGHKDSGTPACMACHGPSGRGNPAASYPALAGQHANYTKAQLTAFRDGQVHGKDAQANAVMANVAAYLSDEDIEALATYIEGLHARPIGRDAAGQR